MPKSNKEKAKDSNRKKTNTNGIDSEINSILIHKNFHSALPSKEQKKAFPHTKNLKEDKRSKNNWEYIQKSFKSYQNQSNTDFSIIDVTESPVEKINLLKQNVDIPKLERFYIDFNSFSRYSTNKQVAFYIKFRDDFHKNIFIDLKGNNNYALKLYYDIIDEHKSHGNHYNLELDLRKLWKNYPITLDQGLNYLIEIFEKNNLFKDVLRIKTEFLQRYKHELGTKYYKSLNLSEEEIKLLNKCYYNSNKLNEIEFCQFTIVRFFINSINFLNKKNSYNSYKNILEKFIKFECLNFNNKYPERGGCNHMKESFVSDFNYAIFEVCENVLRKLLNIRENNIPYEYWAEESKILFDENIHLPLTGYLSKKFPALEVDTESDILINNYGNGRSRYKVFLQNILNTSNSKPLTDIKNQINDLAVRNSKNPYLENIYYQSSVFFAKNYPVESIEYYLQYLKANNKASQFKEKSLPTPLIKKTLKTSNNLKKFEEIVDEFKVHLNIKESMVKVKKLFIDQRKTVILDKENIDNIQKQHDQTVNVLNKYLVDETEDIDNTKIKLKPKEKKPTEPNLQSIFIKELKFSSIQLFALDIFIENNLSIKQKDFSKIIKEKGFFHSQIIESINELCYDIIDDILIEENEDFYSINSGYLKEIKNEAN